VIWGVVAAAILVIAYLALSRLGMQPARHKRQRREDLSRFLNHWAEYGDDGAVLIIEHETSERFLQFAKSRRRDGKWDLSFAFPDAPWSRPYYPNVRELLDLQGIRFEEIETGEGPTTRFLRVGELDGALEALAVLDAALEGLELGPEATYVVQFEGRYDVRRAHEDWKRRLVKWQGRQH
jgi:hypothetical protein